MAVSGGRGPGSTKMHSPGKDGSCLLNSRSAVLAELGKSTRKPGKVMTAEELGSARSNRHSFSRSMIRAAYRDSWSVSRHRFEIDEFGHGKAVYRLNTGAAVFHLVVFSRTIADDCRTDRVIAQAWDVTAALCEGNVDEDAIDRMEPNVTVQEAGRADARTLVWCRANRSVRYFDYVVDCLASGFQPSSERVGDDSYLMRSTAFYGNGKFGLVDFDGYGDKNQLRVPYRAQMVAAWLLREFSLDLVDHCAGLRNASAVRLNEQWRRFFGLGNATGLGLVPYLVKHPVVLDAWVSCRELALENALRKQLYVGGADYELVVDLLDRAILHFGERTVLSTEPFLKGPEIADKLRVVRSFITGYRADRSVPLSARTLHQEADLQGAETRQVVDSILVELDSSLDEKLEAILWCDETGSNDYRAPVLQLLEIVETAYAWALKYDFDDPKESHYFWYISANNEEPRRRERESEDYANKETPIDIARLVQDLRSGLASVEPGIPIGEYLLKAPWHRQIVDRVLRLSTVTYGEAQVNLISENFVPLDLQRIQLAMYGMENYSPQSTDWLRVTLFSGAPRVDDVNEKKEFDWMFTLKPTEETPV